MPLIKRYVSVSSKPDHPLGRSPGIFTFSLPRGASFRPTFFARGSGFWIRERRWQVKFCGPWSPPPPSVWADLFLTWHRDYLVSLILIFIIFCGITMHYNAFLAVLFLRVVLYGPQNLFSFKKFPCTDGLGSTETATSCTATQVIPFEKYEWLRDSKSIIWNWILHSGVFWGSCCWLQLQPLDQKAYLTPDLRQARKVSPVFPVSAYHEK